MQVSKNGKEYTVVDGEEWFWNIFADGSWEPGTFRIFDQFLVPDKAMLDIGAWIGPTALYAAGKVKDVFAFEPDLVAYESLIQNLALNRAENVVPYPVAVSNQFTGIPFGPKNGYGDSMSSQLWAKDDVKVPAISLTGLIVDTDPGFIKIDIEGGEKFIFDDKSTRHLLETYKPTIHLSLHTPWFTDDLESFKRAIVDGIGFYPYFYDEHLRPIELEQAFDVNSFNAVVATYKKLV